MHLIDITMEITPEMRTRMRLNEAKSLEGHLGTHFDVMDKTFPLVYTKRNGIAFDVRFVQSRDIEPDDIRLDQIPAQAFVAFYTGFIEKAEYGTDLYRHFHPQLSYTLIDALLQAGVSIIGIDFAGIRRGKEHTPADQRCADRGAFVVENLCSLDQVLEGKETRSFLVHTYPMRYTGISGLPCRVIAERND